MIQNPCRFWLMRISVFAEKDFSFCRKRFMLLQKKVSAFAEKDFCFC